MAIRCAALAVLLVPAVALAQTSPAGPPAPQPAPSSAPAPSASAVTPATGYGWSKTPAKPARSYKAGAAAPKPFTQDDVLPGFEELEGGGSRFFVELAKNVQVEELKAPGVLTYVIHGVRVKLRNNKNALITVHFNTPAYRARIVPKGNDLLFVIDLRNDVPATWRVVPGSDGTAMLQVDFPGGAYVPNTAPTAPASPPR